ncbi:MAG: baseplate protein [Caldilinea sp. CFX5]|nr:baseplate protein [Caldilinea sp. CFX5]
MSNGSGHEFLGVGWAFPIATDAEDHIQLAQLEESVRQSIFLIIGTAKGERLMHPTFGCGIHDLVFAPNDTTTAALISYEVREALVDWEPRIQVLEVQVTQDRAEAQKLLVHLQYRVRNTNNVFNLVYPFYLERSGV